MGTWGSGNFDDDTAADHLSSITAKLRDDIAKAIADAPGDIEPDEYGGVMVPCNVELLALIAKQRWVGTTLPAADTVAQWKKTYLAVWDGYIDDLEPSPEWKKKRRAVLAKTFDALHAQCAAREEQPKTKPAAKKKQAKKTATR